MSGVRLDDVFLGRCRRCGDVDDPTSARLRLACAANLDLDALAELSSVLNQAGRRAERAGDFKEAATLLERGRRLRDYIEADAAHERRLRSWRSFDEERGR